MSESESFRLALTGDSMVTRRTSLDGDPDARELRHVIESADLAFTNLEVLPNDFRGYPALESGGTHLAAHSWVVDELLQMGFDLFSAANNHALDYSIEGLLAALEVLERKRVAFAGIGRNLAEARMPAYLEHRGGTVALLCCSSTFAKGNEAGEQRPDMQGRPGLNPLHVETIYEVTEEQLATLRAIAEGLNLERIRLRTIDLGFAFPPDAPDLFPFLQRNFRAADGMAVKTSPRASDQDALARWVREARNRADTVLVSVHSHEPGEGEGDLQEVPAAFLQGFAHRMIDEGADLIVCHGPHLLRGMEIYAGKPIFYSLGNFIAQNDLVYKLPADAYSSFRVDPSQTPSEVFRSRSQNDTKGFPGDSRYWESVVPILSFGGGELRGIELVPIVLGHGQPAQRRGRPRLARGQHAEAILQRFGRLSAPFGARLALNSGQASVLLPA